MLEEELDNTDYHSDDLYENIQRYYEGLSSKNAHLFSAATILMLSNYVDSQKTFFKVLTEVKTILFCDVENDHENC